MVDEITSRYSTGLLAHSTRVFLLHGRMIAVIQRRMLGKIPSLIYLHLQLTSPLIRFHTKAFSRTLGDKHAITGERRFTPHPSARPYQPGPWSPVTQEHRRGCARA